MIDIGYITLENRETEREEGREKEREMCKEIFNETYLSNEITTRVKTLEATVTCATKLLMVQYTIPKGQLELRRKMKLKAQLSNDIIRSAMERFTKK